MKRPKTPPTYAQRETRARADFAARVLQDPKSPPGDVASARSFLATATDETDPAEVLKIKTMPPVLVLELRDVLKRIAAWQTAIATTDTTKPAA